MFLLFISYGEHILHFSDIILSAMTSQITRVSTVCPTVCPSADQRLPQSSASLVFVWEIHWWSVDSPHKGPVIRKMFPFDDVIMLIGLACRVELVDFTYYITTDNPKQFRLHLIMKIVVLFWSVIEDTFTTFEIQTWLPDFIVGINPFQKACVWRIWAGVREVTYYLGRTQWFLLSSINWPILNHSINCQIQIGNAQKKVIGDWE